MKQVAHIIESVPLTLEEIAARSGLSLARVRAIRDGETASLEELRSLARGLRVPLRSFSNKSKSDTKLSMLFRQSAGARPDMGVEAITEFVEAALSVLPSRKHLAEWIIAARGPSQTYENAQELATRWRQKHVGNELDPLTILPDLLVNLGGMVLGRLDTSRFEGASLVVDGYAFIFVSPRFPGRMLFTLAHELGHLLGHHGTERSATFDLASQIGSVRRVNKAEAFADAFASNLLMPSTGVAIALREIRNQIGSKADALGDIEILYLALFYGVSFEVAARRCEQLELLPEGGAYSLYDNVKRKHESPEKLAAQLGLPPRAPISFPRASFNLIEAAIEKVEAGDISIGWATDRFGVSTNDLHAVKATRDKIRGNSSRR